VICAAEHCQELPRPAVGHTGRDRRVLFVGSVPDLRRECALFKLCYCKS
jgi:hypothetical protein